MTHLIDRPLHDNSLFHTLTTQLAITHPGFWKHTDCPSIRSPQGSGQGPWISHDRQGVDVNSTSTSYPGFPEKFPRLSPCLYGGWSMKAIDCSDSTPSMFFPSIDTYDDLLLLLLLIWRSHSLLSSNPGLRHPSHRDSKGAFHDNTRWRTGAPFLRLRQDERSNFSSGLAVEEWWVEA